MSSTILGERLAELMRINQCTREYTEQVVASLERALRQRDNTMQAMFDVIDELNKLQPTLNTMNVITFILDAAFTTFGMLSVIGGVAGGCATGVISGANYIIKNNLCNRVIKKLRNAMIEDKRERDNLQLLLHQVIGCALPDLIEFEAEMGVVHKVFLAISKYVTGDRIDWIKHLENIGIVGIIPVVPSSQRQIVEPQDTTTRSSNWRLIFEMVMKSIKFFKGILEKIPVVGPCLVAIEKIIRLFYQIWNKSEKWLDVFSAKCHPTSEILETSYVPELMRDTEIMLTLLEKLQEEL